MTRTCENGAWVGAPWTGCREEFAYEAARSAITDAPLDPDVAEEVGSDSFLTDLAAYAEYDGTPLADLPNTDNITIMPERWALTYTKEGVTTGMFLPETRNFDPEVGLPDELPGIAIIALRQSYPLYYEQYLSNMEADYRNSRADVEFDSATYGPDANCSYPPRTDLGGGFALQRIAPTLCRPDDTIEARDPITSVPVKARTGRDIVWEPFNVRTEEVWDEAWVDVDVSRCCESAPPDPLRCVEVICGSQQPPYPDGYQCGYTCTRNCTGYYSTLVTCRDGTWVGKVPNCWPSHCREPEEFDCTTRTDCSAPYLNDCRDPKDYSCALRTGCDPPFIHGETCHYQCDQERGCCGIPPFRNWAVYTCDEPGTPYPSGTMCTYRCRKGCSAIPDTTVATCYNGRWYGNRKWRCKKGCGAPPNPPCTKRFGCAPFYWYGESCYYRCYNNKGGYAMEVTGDAIRTCIKPGVWSGTDLICNCKDREECCLVDIVFVLDYSVSMSGDTTAVKNFVYALVNRFEIGDLDALVGVLRYNTGQMLEFYLNAYNNKPDTLAHISGMTTTPGGGTNTGAALTYVANTMLLETNGNRADAPDVVIVLTDGFSWDSVAGPASVLHSMGVQTFAIGVGSCVSDAQLHDIANCDDHVYKLADFNGLEGITTNIHNQICCDKPTDACPENYERVMANGPCLRFSTDRQNYFQARQTCRDEGGRLVVIKSAALDAFIDNRIQTTYASATWIGLDDLTFPFSQYVWSDGSVLGPTDYDDWFGGSPFPPWPFPCVEIRPQLNYKWINQFCWLLNRYICEKVATPPCCPRPRTYVSDPGYTVSDDHAYRLSPAVQCDAPTEEVPDA
ncbi:PREDICTED: uncharacterized protein LOC109462622 [Branchiostoma belcheri]|uniref:Uncharacterized protein LOC109462622 n=1 Tax=Branchiostoma belcheri TaxID=7741 RepID=A0A6P4XW03_BRABE|nr:PREDICTED: uncharacterized protein LOC109462622 [Branchiostoma belcheri]